MKYYGPFFKGAGDSDLWHWHRQCPGFPTAPNPETMISSSIPKKETLCNKCLELDADNPSPFSFFDADKSS